MINVGVIGLGKMGLLHLQNSKLIKNVDVVAVADKSKTARAKAKSYNVKNVYSDYSELFESHKDLDAVVISLPNWLHFDGIKSAIESGVNVFIEKPLAISSNECREIMKLVDQSGLDLMVGHSMRFLDAVTKMKAEIETGKIGKLEAINIEEVMNGPFSHGATPQPVADWWFDSSKSGGGVLLDIGYHLIDLFHFFSGDSDVVFSSLDYKYNLPVEDSAIVVLESKQTGTNGIITTGWYQQVIFPRFDFSLNIHGRAGYLRSSDLLPRNMYVHAVKEGIKNGVRKFTGQRIHPLSYTYFYESHFNELVHFFNCIESGETPSVSAEDALKTIKVIETVYEKNKVKKDDLVI